MTATVVGVAVFCLVAAVACLVSAILFGISDWSAAKKLRDAADKANKLITQQGEGIQPQAAGLAGIDFGGIAKLADSLVKLNLSGRFLVASLAFTAAAIFVTSVGSATR